MISFHFVISYFILILGGGRFFIVIEGIDGYSSSSSNGRSISLNQIENDDSVLLTCEILYPQPGSNVFLTCPLVPEPRNCFQSCKPVCKDCSNKMKNIGCSVINNVENNTLLVKYTIDAYDSSYTGKWYCIHAGIKSKVQEIAWKPRPQTTTTIKSNENIFMSSTLHPIDSFPTISISSLPPWISTTPIFGIVSIAVSKNPMKDSQKNSTLYYLSNANLSHASAVIAIVCLLFISIIVNIAFCIRCWIIRRLIGNQRKISRGFCFCGEKDHSCDDVDMNLLHQLKPNFINNSFRSNLPVPGGGGSQPSGAHPIYDDITPMSGVRGGVKQSQFQHSGSSAAISLLSSTPLSTAYSPVPLHRQYPSTAVTSSNTVLVPAKVYIDGQGNTLFALPFQKEFEEVEMAASHNNKDQTQTYDEVPLQYPFQQNNQHNPNGSIAFKRGSQTGSSFRSSHSNNDINQQSASSVQHSESYGISSTTNRINRLPIWEEQSHMMYREPPQSLYDSQRDRSISPSSLRSETTGCEWSPGGLLRSTPMHDENNRLQLSVKLMNQADYCIREANSLLPPPPLNTTASFPYSSHS